MLPVMRSSVQVELFLSFLSANQFAPSAVAFSRYYPGFRPVTSMYWSGSVAR